MNNFTRTLALFAASALAAGAAQAQAITTVGLVGTATPSASWDVSTPMTRVAGSTTAWTLTTAMNDGEAKFRANDAWDINWGAATFPAGTGTQGGANIPVTAGTYTITLDEVSGEYTFATVTATRAASAAILKMSTFPNPGRDVAVSFELPTASTVAISVLNNLGQTVKTLAPMTKAAGSNAQALSLGNLAAGIYTVKLQAGEYVQTSRVVVE
jgi:hypothetical protein